MALTTKEVIKMNMYVQDCEGVLIEVICFWMVFGAVSSLAVAAKPREIFPPPSVSFNSVILHL